MAETSTVSTGVYIVRRRMLIELIEKSMQEERYDFVKVILIRYKNVKKIYAYPWIPTGAIFLRWILITTRIWIS